MTEIPELIGFPKDEMKRTQEQKDATNLKRIVDRRRGGRTARMLIDPSRIDSRFMDLIQAGEISPCCGRVSVKQANGKWRCSCGQEFRV